MFKNYIKVTIRSLLKYKSYSFINVFGLAIGIATCLLILFFVQHELSYDRFHEKSDRIYRTIYHAQYGGKEAKMPVAPAILPPLLQREFPGIADFVRIYPKSQFGPVVVDNGVEKFTERRFFYADSSLLSVFTFPLIHGNPETALRRPFSLVVTETTARKLFGSENPIGQKLRLDDSEDFEITGVLQDLPLNSHLQFDYIASWTSLKNWRSASEEEWGPANFITYFELKENAQIEALVSKMPSLIRRTKGKDTGENFLLQPLPDIHLHSGDLRNDAFSTGDIGYIYGFTAIAVLLLLIACINYMNLATARSARRAKEVGVRKVVGANRAYLAMQFIGESLLVTGIGVALAIGLVELCLPYFTQLIGQDIDIRYLGNPATLATILIVALVVSFVAGSYPALFLSGFKPAAVLKGDKQKNSAAAKFRKVLVVFQFAVSVFLIIGTVIVNSQIDYMRNKKLGFKKEQIIHLPISDQRTRENYESLKQALLQHTSIAS